MTRTWWIALGLLLVAARPAVAQAPKHNCGFCHNVHGGSFAQLTDFPTSEDLCLSCHSDAGPATVDRDGVPVAIPKNVAIHNGAKHTSPTTCRSCHDHEGESGGNLALVPRTLGTPNSGARTVVFTARSGPNSFADGDATYDGACEVCHTVTDQHRNDGSAGKHNAAADCRACHQHRSGFQGQGGCTLCHNQPQDNGDNVPPGGRRAIVGEFARRSHHVQVTPADSIPDADCLVCHNLDQHQQGQVRLVNVDNAGIVTLTGDPLAVSAEAAKLAPFCLACHDANGAAGDVTPFSDNVTRPLIDSTSWAVASHKTAPVLAGCYGNGTTGCHATGHGSLKKALLSLPTVAPLSPDSVSEQEGFCYNCHDGSPASTNVQAEFQKGTNTATQIFHHPVRNTEQSGGRAVECTHCHQPHAATAGNQLKGVTGVDLNGNPVGPGTANPRDVAEYEVCLTCHGNSAPVGRDINGDGHADVSNKRLDFATTASAYHPVQQVGRNQSGALQAQLVGGQTVGSVIRCSDCHNNEQTANAIGAAANSTARPQGPHGSTISPILRAAFDLRTIQPEGQATSSQFTLCFLCHDKDRLKGEANNNIGRDFGAGARTNFYGGSKDNLHWFHLSDNAGATCRTCHYDSHGNQSAASTIYRIIDPAVAGGTPQDFASGPPMGYKTRMVNFSPSVQARGFAKAMFQINVGTRYRSCDLTCHGKQHVLNGGDFTYNPQARHGQAGQDNDALKY